MRIGHSMLPIASSPRPTPVAITTKFGPKLAITRLDISARFFAYVGVFSEMGHQMLLIEFCPDRPLLLWQQNLRQDGLHLGLYNKYHEDRCI